MEKAIERKINGRYLIVYFFIYAVIGWMLETVYAFGVLGHFVKRGFLFGPLCPLYGYGAVILISGLKKYKSNPVKLFVYSAIICSVFEYLAGFILDALFAGRWWDYTNDFMNLNGRISIFYTFAWGVIALLFMNYIQPFVEKNVKKIIKKISPRIQCIIIQLLLVILIIDTVLSSLKYLTLL